MAERAHPELIERMLHTALARDPASPITALSPDGWFVPLPDNLPAGTHPVLQAQTALELVVDADRNAVISAWARTRAVGAANVLVHLLDEPDRPVVMLMMDVRERYGVLAMVLVPDADSIGDLITSDGPRLTPRYCQMRRNDLAYVVEADEASALMFGWSLESMAGRRSLELIHPEDHERAIDNWLAMLAGPGRATRWRGRYLTADGRWMWVEITNHNRLEDPAHNDVLTEMVNIDDEMSMHEELRAREELFRELTQALPVGVLQADREGHVVFTNDRLCEILGVGSVPTLDSLRSRVIDDDIAAFDAALAAALGNGQPRDLEMCVQAGSGGQRAVCQVNLRPLLTTDGVATGVLACLSDVTESARLRDELEVRATYDALTGCHNRASTMRELDRHVLVSSEAEPTERHHAGVVFIDLDQFKPVNDRYGHSVGDQVLVEVAERLRGCTRSDDIVGRIGGDEFVVISPGVGDPEALDDLAQRVRSALNGEVALGVGSVPLRASVGAILAAPGADSGVVLAEADAAMYTAKRARMRVA